MMRLRFVSLICFVGCLFVARAAPLDAKTLLPAEKDGSKEYTIHLPGIAGERNLDRQFVRGLREGGYAGILEIYDWTQNDPGLSALLARKRNENEAKFVAEKIEKLLQTDPKLKIRLVGHSGGAGIATWALERLPDDMKVESVVFLAPALSPRYDLSKSLSHVRGKIFAFTSEFDTIVLGAGTSLFGTIDGVKGEASGLRGFTKPEGADANQYAKLVPMPYATGYMDFGNIGDHIGPMTRTFARTVISPVLQDREPPRPATRPVRSPAATTRATTRPRK